MIIGAHTLVFSSNPDADHIFFRDVLELPHVDAGGGFLIYGLPPSEVAVHEAESGGTHELYLMCDDVEAFVSAMEARDVPVTPPEDQGWGIVTHVTLPGGGRLGVYEPRHPRPTVAISQPEAGGPKRRPAKKAAKKVAKKASKAKPAKSIKSAKSAKSTNTVKKKVAKKRRG